MEGMQETLRWFAELLFRLKLMEAQVNVMDISDMTDYGIAELKAMANNFIVTGDNIQEEIRQKAMEVL